MQLWAIVILLIIVLLGASAAAVVFYNFTKNKKRGPPPGLPPPVIPPSPSGPPPSPKADRGHFRAVPLSYYTPDGRNDKYFTTNSYGIRVAWIGSMPPAENFTVAGQTYQWNKKGTIDCKKGNGWPTDLPFAFTDLSVPFGQQTVTVTGSSSDDDYKYNLIVPSVGVSDTDMLFIGDVQTQEGGWGLSGAADVLVEVLGNSKSTSLIVFPGDIFYNNSPYIKDVAWSATPPQGLARGTRPITDFLVVAVPGNHDYDALGCGPCNFSQPRGSLKCTASPSTANAMWVPVFFATDAMKSFNDGLSEAGQPACAVPIEYTLQIYVIGTTCLVLADNVWKPEDSDAAVGGDWSKVASRLPSSVTTVIVSTHWDGRGAGAISDTLDWTNYLKGKFPGKKVFGDANHTHTNTVLSGDPGIVKSGGNGFRGAGCGCQGTCQGCDCCCPSMWTKDGQWIPGGWRQGQLCATAAKNTNQLTAIIRSSMQATLSTNITQLAAFNNNIHVPLTEQETLRWFAPPFLVDDAVYPRIRGGPFENLKQSEPSWNPNAAASPLREDWYPPQLRATPEITKAYNDTYEIDRGYPSCRSLSPFPNAADPGFTCWDDTVHPRDVFELPP